MSIEVLSFILGGLLVGVGILGGGIEIRELKIPQVGKLPRVCSLIAGFAFIGLAVLLSTKQFEETEHDHKKVATMEQQTFSEPTYGDLRLDACYEWAMRCGEEAASAWCKTKGFKRAVDYPTENVGNRGISTRLIGTQAVCKEPFCASFSHITCE